MSNRSMRPAFVAQLLARPVPALQRKPTASLDSRLYSPMLQGEIEKLRCHSLVVSCLHLLNDDLASADSNLKKLQQADTGGFTSWIRGILAATSGDLGFAKVCYKETREEVLKTYHHISPSISPALQGSHLLDHLSLLFGRTPASVYQETVAADLVVRDAWNEADLVGRAAVRGIGGETIEQRVLRMRWEELCSVFESVEEKYGWGTAQL